MNELKDGFHNPNLVLPYRKMAFRDKAYPYVLGGATTLLIVLVIIYTNLVIVK